MDDLLFDQWQNNHKPFDQTLIRLPNGTPITTLAMAVQVIAQKLSRLYPSETLRVLDDWHEHDGYISASKATSWEDFRVMLSTEKSLCDNAPGDTYVRLAVYPDDLSFLFRIYVLDEYESSTFPGRNGSFDVTANSETISELVCILSPLLGIELIKESSKAYFDRTYAG